MDNAIDWWWKKSKRWHFKNNCCSIFVKKFKLLCGQTTSYLRCAHFLREARQLRLTAWYLHFTITVVTFFQSWWIETKPLTRNFFGILHNKNHSNRLIFDWQGGRFWTETVYEYITSELVLVAAGFYARSQANKDNRKIERTGIKRRS